MSRPPPGRSRGTSSSRRLPDGSLPSIRAPSVGRGDNLYPWHYVPVFACKPSALRNGAPFKDRVLPAAIKRIRRKLGGAEDGNQQMANILNADLTDGLPAVELASASAFAHGVRSADVVLNILARQQSLPHQPTPCPTSQHNDAGRADIEPRPDRLLPVTDPAATAPGASPGGISSTATADS